MFFKLMLMLILMTTLFFILSNLLKTEKFSTEKFSPFECGFDPSHEIHQTFSLRFFILTMVFLLFDTEITLMFPLPFNLTENLLLSNTNSHLILLFLLLGGLIFEWSQGVLDWFWFYI